MSDIKITDDTNPQTDVKKITVRELVPYNEVIKQYVEKCDTDGKDPEDYKNIENKVLIEALDSLTVGKFAGNWTFESLPIDNLFIDEQGESIGLVEEWPSFIVNCIYRLPSDLAILLMDKFLFEEVLQCRPNEILIMICENCHYKDFDHFPVVEWLINKFPGLDPHVYMSKETKSLTAFETACKVGHLKIVQLFIDKCKHGNKYGLDYKPAYKLAHQNTHYHIMELLTKTYGKWKVTNSI